MKSLWLLALLAAVGTASQGDSISVLGVGEAVDGHSQAHYVERWWQWAMQLQDGDRAFQDPSGRQCGMNQDGPVWFLAGTEGTMRVHRICELPQTRYVFFPIISTIAHAAPGRQLDCREATAQVRKENDALAQATVELDGRMVKGLSAHRVRTTGCFNTFVKAKYLEHPEAYATAAADGYWLMLGPLKEGVHHLIVHARYNDVGLPAGTMEQDFDYELRVVPHPTAVPRDPDTPVPPLLPDGLIST